MGLLDRFIKKEQANSSEPVGSALNPVFSSDGVRFEHENSAVWDERDLTAFGPSRELASFLFQIEEEGFASRTDQGMFLAWGDAYRLMESEDHVESWSLLGLPSIEAWRPNLSSKGALSDPDFSIHLSGWKTPDGSIPKVDALVEGALLKVGSKVALLPRPAWEAVQKVFEFRRARAAGAEATPDANRKAWAAIRSKAIAAGAGLSDFLAKTVVLTPEKLDIALRKSGVEGTNVVEVIPGFDGAPAKWLDAFQKAEDVPERYEVADGEGLTHVVISPEVRTVLREIRRMPGQRVAGDRAEAFIRNPFATLGPDASLVIDPVQFEQAREDAGISFAQFSALIHRDAKGHPVEIGLSVQEAIGRELTSETVLFAKPDDLRKFLGRLDARISAGSVCCHWEGYDLEILGDTPSQADALRKALGDWERPSAPTAEEVLDISRYSARIDGFGVDKPVYSAYIARKNDEESWFPDNVEFGVLYTDPSGETVSLPIEDRFDDFKKALDKAKAEGKDSFELEGFPKPIPVEWADSVVQDKECTKTQEGLDEVTTKLPEVQIEHTPNGPKERLGLMLKDTVLRLDYEEKRGQLPPASMQPAVPPAKLNPGVALKEHQTIGLGWLMHLWSFSPNECRGALLGDDMGLGKTLQLLSFMAKVLEENPKADPFLVVAPVSLLENWADEMGKFFEAGTFRALTLYGDALASKRVPKAALDAELEGKGITRLLKSDWLGNANLVLTTYETLRDLEFSLAAQPWSAMICDEAQKIKNPNAMVTRAAKKQNARFKIACTGTPVENTLADIWCLYDFVQPGLLGALNEFGERYRKPIEAETDEEKQRVEELRVLIAPQLLRRTKAEVAKDLPKKIEVAECRSLLLSRRQRELYADAISSFRNGAAVGGMSNHLGLLQYLRRLCSDPKPPGVLSTDSMPLTEIEQHSPKMAWLLKTLHRIRDKGEKVIVFCEFRDLQRTLQRAISERLGVTPDVINGSVAASSSSTTSRQKRIKAFQDAKGFGVIVLSPLAVGFGVNIQAANHVIHFTRTWNPAKEDQATDRAYRIGQTKDVYVYYPVVTAEEFLTFDAKLDKLLGWKRGLSNDMLNGTGDVSPSEFGDLGAPDGGSAFGSEQFTPSDLDAVDPDAFEALCALLWSKAGYRKTRRTRKSGDGGVDVVAISGREGVLIQCKSSTVDDAELGWEAVKDVVAGAAAYSAKHPGVSFSLVAATNKRFNGTARSQATSNKVTLYEGNQLASMLLKTPVTRSELSQYLFEGWDKQ